MTSNKFVLPIQQPSGFESSLQRSVATEKSSRLVLGLPATGSGSQQPVMQQRPVQTPPVQQQSADSPLVPSSSKKISVELTFL
ncbi:hypothetical protein Hanom_Chr07g00636421 [Helianthus anomalus]